MAPVDHGRSRTPSPLASGADMIGFMRELHPLCRSITGPGLRQTLARIDGRVGGLRVEEVGCGSAAFDWTVPAEWTVREAWVRGPDGSTVVDLRHDPLHLVGYSEPVHRRMPLAELRPHLHSLSQHPDWIPYRTSYYRRTWGFCLPHRLLERLPEGEYEVRIDSELDEHGRFAWGELALPGQSDEEVLLSTHVCHPSLCNDNLSGIAVATALAEWLRDRPRRWSYRFLFLPGGIGSVVWLSRNQDRAAGIRAGLVLNCLGDPAPFTYKRSRRGDAEVDLAARCALRDAEQPYRVIGFSPYGYDERNFCSPRFDLPVGSLTRSTHASYRGYHSSGDDFTVVDGDALAGSLAMYQSVVTVLERNAVACSRAPDAEPQLGKRGLYGLAGGLPRRARPEVAMLWVMNQADGETSLLQTAWRSGIPFPEIADAADRLAEHGLVELRPTLAGGHQG